MLELAALQKQMTAAVLCGDMAPIAQEFTRADRLSIFHNNSFASLTLALQSTFPVTAKLADERFFAYAAREFITHNPPREARLSAYGQSFPAFLAGFPPCRRYPIIAEMASFEWAIAAALNEAHEPAAPIAQLKAGAEFVTLQPSLRFVISHWPLVDLWRSQGSANAQTAKRGFVRMALARSGEDLQFFTLDAAQFAFWRGLANGQPLEQAAARALAREPLFDIVQQTLHLFRRGLVTNVTAA